MSRMLLTDKQIAQFQVIYKARFGKSISRAEAYDMSAKLVRMMQIIYKPMAKADYDQLQERRRQTAGSSSQFRVLIDCCKIGLDF
jgi:hypothetical protein